MKKILLICTLMLAIVLSFVACSGNNNPPSNNEGNNNETPHTHSFGEWEVTVKPTCTEDGTKIRYCSCGEKQSATIQKTEHTFDEWNVIKEATPEQNGLKISFCECGEEEILEIVVSKSTISYTDALQKIDTAFKDGFKQDYWSIKNIVSILGIESSKGEYAKMPNGNSSAYYTYTPNQGIDGETVMKTWVIETENGFIHMTEENNSGESLKYYYILNEITPLYQALFDINNPNTVLNLLTQCNCENVSIVNIEGKEYFTFTDCPSGFDNFVVVMENNLPIMIILSQATIKAEIVYSYIKQEFVVPDVQDFDER